MTLYQTAAFLLALVALVGYLNHRYLRLPTTIGIVLIALVSSLLLLAADGIFPSLALGDALRTQVLGIDFNRALMVGMLSFLLFAGALHMDLEDLMARRWVILGLATVGVLISTFLVALATWLILPLLGLDLPFKICLIFGALISPTDPIAVLGILKAIGAPKDLSAVIGGESLFNDGVGVVVFLVVVALAGLGGHSGASPDAAGVARLFGQEVLGGVLMGLALGGVAFWALKSIDAYVIEVQITLALVMGLTVIGARWHLSAPLGVVIAGLLLGNQGRRFAMSDQTIHHLETFWELVDEILNAVLFLLIGLEVFAISLQPRHLAAGLLIVPCVLIARFIAVGIPVRAIAALGRPLGRGAIPVLTWSGLRGGISVALVLSLPRFPGRDILVTITYVVVLFSILVQGLTVKGLVARTIENDPAAAPRGRE